MLLTVWCPGLMRKGDLERRNQPSVRKDLPSNSVHVVTHVVVNHCRVIQLMESFVDAMRRASAQALCRADISWAAGDRAQSRYSQLGCGRART